MQNDLRALFVDHQVSKPERKAASVPLMQKPSQKLVCHKADSQEPMTKANTHIFHGNTCHPLAKHDSGS